LHLQVESKSYVPPLEHQKYIPSQIHVLGATTKGKTVILKEKGGIPWEIKAGKKTKHKNRKPNNRKKGHLPSEWVILDCFS